MASADRLLGALIGALLILGWATASCDADVAFDVHDNLIALDPCALVEHHGEACHDLPVPREEGEPCDGTAPCADDLTCLCSVCLDPEDLL